MVLIKAKNIEEARKKAVREQKSFNKYLSKPYVVNKIKTTNRKGFYEVILRKSKR